MKALFSRFVEIFKSVFGFDYRIIEEFGDIKPGLDIEEGIEFLRNQCDWGSVDKVGIVYQDTCELMKDDLDFNNAIENAKELLEELKEDSSFYSDLHNYIAGVVDTYDELQGEEISV